MKTNPHFAKLNNRIPEYAPVPIKVVTHHHEGCDIAEMLEYGGKGGV